MRQRREVDLRQRGRAVRHAGAVLVTCRGPRGAAQQVCRAEHAGAPARDASRSSRSTTTSPLTSFRARQTRPLGIVMSLGNPIHDAGASSRSSTRGTTRSATTGSRRRGLSPRTGRSSGERPRAPGAGDARVRQRRSRGAGRRPASRATAAVGRGAARRVVPGNPIAVELEELRPWRRGRFVVQERLWNRPGLTPLPAGKLDIERSITRP